MEVSLSLRHRPSRTQIATLQTEPIVTLTKSEQLWKEAYQTVKEREPTLVENYEKNLSPQNTTFTSQDQIQDAVKTSLHNREASQIIVSLAGKSVRIREYGEKLVKFTMWSKDLISSAVSAEPHAALAWAGISLLLPLVLSPSQESDAMLRGLDAISDLIQLYKIREVLYLNTSDQRGFEEAVIQLYSYIFEYQARMLCHLSRKSVTRAFQNIIKAGQWDDLLRTAREWDSRCLSYSNLIDLQLEREQWDRQSLQRDRSQHIQEIILHEMKAIRSQRVVERDEDLQQNFFHAFSSRYSDDKDFNPSRVPDTCEWFLEDAKFRDWQDSKTSCVLWVSAGPGCGKSVLSKSLVDERLVSRRAMTSTVCYFFFKEGQEGRQNGANALTAMLHQLYSSHLHSSLIKYALDKFKLHGKSLVSMFGELWRILTETAKDPDAGEIICVVDALDECEQRAREQFLNELINFYSRRNVHSDAGIRLKFLITGRPYDSLRSSLDRLLDTASYIHFDADDNYNSISQDINKVIDHNIPQILRNKFDEEGQKQVADSLKLSKQRTYLWLYLVLDVIKRQVATHRTPKKMKNLIGNLPSSVSAAYEQILDRSPDAQLARDTLQIILASRRPLTVPEINVALEIASGDTHTSYDDLDLQSEDAFKSSLREICGLFIAIHDAQVYLIHQTAREFLLAKPGFGQVDNGVLGIALRWEHSITVGDAETLMAKICMSLLLFEDFSELPILGTHVLLEYASEHWVYHLQNALTPARDSLMAKVHNFYDVHGVLYNVWFPIFWRATRPEEEQPEMNSIRLATLLGDETMLKILLRSNVDDDIDDPDELGRTALMWASAIGYEKLVHILIQGGADVNAQASRGNALYAASEHGHEAIVQMLVDAGANVNAQERYFHGSPLYVASEHGYEAIVRILVDAGADVNAQGGYYEKPLHTASKHGHEKVVQILVNRGAVVDAEGKTWSTALFAASEGGHDKIVQILVDRGANVNAEVSWYVDHVGSFTWSALQAASEGGYTKVVKILVERGASIGADGYCGTALRYASQAGYEEIVQILLERGVSSHDRNSSLHAALTNDCERVVQMLLDAGADVDAQGEDGNALYTASANGRESVVQMLLDAGASVNAKGGRHGSALQAASAKGHEKVVRMLLDNGANDG